MTTTPRPAPLAIRAIPDDLEPVCKQWLLNLAATGHQIVDSDGVDVAAETLDRADQINAEYDVWVASRAGVT